VSVDLVGHVGVALATVQFTIIAVADRDARSDVDALAEGMRASLHTLAGSTRGRPGRA
jgi:hypothetical protein